MMQTVRSRGRLALGSLLLLSFSWLGPPAALGQDEPEDPAGPTLGLLLEPSNLTRLPDVAEAAAHPALVQIRVAWADVERRRGVYDWSRIEPELRSIRQAGYRTALVLEGPRPAFLEPGGLPSATGDGASLEAWLGFVRSAGRTFAGRVELLQIWSSAEVPARMLDPRDYAFVLKSSALAIRAETGALDLAVGIAQLAIMPGELDWQRDVWGQDVAAYADVLPLRLDAGDPLAAGAGLRTALEESLRHPPAATLWVRVGGPAGTAAPERAAVALEALASGASVALVEPPTAAEVSDTARWIGGAQRMLSAGYAAAPLGRLRLEDPTGRPIDGSRALARFFSDEDFSTVIFYAAPGRPTELPEDRLIVDTTSVRDVRWLGPLDGKDLRVGSSPAPRGGHGRSIRIARGRWPMAVTFRKARAQSGIELPTQEVETTRDRGLTAEEIIARYQQVQKEQDDRLERWSGQGRIDFHFKFATGGGSVEISIDSNYFWERGGKLEWEQTEYYINGNRVRWKEIPELPFIQPEKVITLPLDLTLDRSYRYRLVGRGKVARRECYVLEFQPADPDAPASLYRGRLWIDVESFVRRQVSLIQSGLESPVLTNEEIDRYGPHPGPGGETFWMLDDINGQQTWNVAGRTFVVRREVVLASIEINPPRDVFEERRNRAYASDHQMLRDTDEGFRYLERQPDGTRLPKDGVDTSQLFAAVGAFQDAGAGDLTPLAGVNYFNFDLGGKDIQFNAFFAGVLGFFNLSKPELFGRRIDLTFDATLIGIKSKQRVFLGENEIVTERVKQRNQNLALRLGIPVGKFWKIDLIGGLNYRDYSDSSEAAAAREAYNTMNPPQDITFITPPDHFQTTWTLQTEFNRRGYTWLNSVSFAERSKWEAWGTFDNQPGGGFVSLDPGTGLYVSAAPEAVEDRFSRWGSTVFKEWFLPRFLKLRAEINYLDGSQQDRFSRYAFSFFGDDRLNGFSETGVRFDEGLIARVGYGFNLFDVIRFELGLDRAWVRQDEAGSGSQAFSGIGLSSNFVGPWKTVISLNYGYALDSDIPDLEGEQEFLLVILKLF